VNLEKNSILLALTSAGSVVYGGREIGLSGIRPLVRRLTQKEEMPVIIQVDQGANAATLVRVIDESKLGGARTVSVAAEPGG
jgi:biopolymer transport protein ExbD